MVDPRTIAASVLGIALGLVFILFPETIRSAHTVGRLPHDRSGEYGATDHGSDRVVLLIRLVGVAAVGIGGYLGAMALL